MNVISITDRENTSNNGAARRPPLLQSARDTACRLLGDAFREMLDHADDMLFAFAEKAENNTQQSLYFDAMRELRTKRAPLHRAFMEGLQHGYDRRCQRGMSNRSPSASAGATALSLLDDATMEQDITVAGLAERIGNIAREELFALNQRIGSLMGIENLASEDNPLGPSSIVEAVRDAADCLSVELKIRLIVLKLFERHVAALVPAIYGRVNQHLIDKGVLPTLVTQVRRQPMRAPMHSSAAAADVGNAPVSAADMLNMITQLVQPGAVSGSATMPLVPLNIGTLRTLTELQQQPLASLSSQSVPSAKFLVELQRGGVLPQMGPAGDMTVDIVAMLFEYILEDRNLPEEFRARLARLQIPVLKVALIDREFFSRKGHPARRLLNLIAECGTTSVTEPALAKDLVSVVDKIVQQIVTHFDQDVGIFQRGVDVLQAAVEKLRRDAALRTARTTRVLDGRAQLERAKEQARNLVDTRLRPDGVPEVVRNFLLTHWKRLLITAICKNGEDGEDVRTAIKTMDQLVWSTLPKTGAEDRKKLVRMLPDLLAQLKKGMEALSIPQVARNGFLSKLEKAHSEVMRGAVAAAAMSHIERAAEPVASTVNISDEMPTLPTLETSMASEVPGGFEMLDITTGEVSGDINELLAAEARRPDAPVADVPVPVIELEHETGSSSQPVITEMQVPERLETTQPDQSEKKAAALRILEQAQSAAEQLRARLDSEDEVKLSDVMPPADSLPSPAPSNRVNALLDITANTFVKIFSQSPEARGEASQGLEFEELTLGDTRHPALPNPEDQYLDQVKNLKPGTWLELKREDGSTIQARFARYSEETTSYNFTDKAGRLVVERTLQGLVADFRRGSIRELAEPPGAMDRAFTRLLDPSTWRNRNR